MTSTPDEALPPETETPQDPAEAADAADSAVPEEETERLIDDIEGYRE